ncbi:MAG: hypothetical protein A2Z14_05160 [Chloroflexi bacterium RBG_16_48_8]|nr:MAG: hypothetical protein A2Z14_05160 [Chloroflexi bacterium RBG_16_48_8]
MIHLLEDERIERAVATLYPIMVTAIRLVGDWMYDEAESQGDDMPYLISRPCSSFSFRWMGSPMNTTVFPPH